MTVPLLVFADAEHDEHDTPEWHPEHRGRLDAALRGITEAGLDEAVGWRTPEPVRLTDLVRVHHPDYLDRLQEFCENGGGNLDADTVATAGSWDTARRAAGAVVGAIDALRAGECDVAFAAGRPPGHHAVPGGAMGFCLFNNVSVGAAKLAAAGERVAIVDWDVHHGNGTQDIFYNDPNVLYVSTHQAPAYPGTGMLRERGDGAGHGTTLNLPFPADTAGNTYREAFDELIIPVIERFNPDWLFISAGFDAHRDDPLAEMGLTSADYGDFAVRLQRLVPAHRLMVVLEGGYNLQALTRSVGATMSALTGGAYRPEPASGGEVGRPTVLAARQLWEV